MKKRWTRVWLKIGEHIEFEGKPWEVIDVNDCAAAIQELYPVPKPVAFGTREFKACKGRKTRIAPTSLVPRLEVT
jgi:hypothetical protein